MTVTTATRGTDWTPLLGGPPVSSGADGKVRLTLPPISSLLLRADGQLPAAPPGKPVLKAAPDDVTSLYRLSAAVRGGPATVSFAIRRAAGDWHRLAVDDSSPYRAYLDPAKYRDKERLYAVAVARGLDGTHSVSSVVSFVVRRD